MPISSLLIIQSIFNKCLLEGTLPFVWCQATILPILKQGNNPGALENYRPISLTSQLGKSLEQIILHRLTHFIENNRILSPFQHGFRKGHSALEALAELGDTVASAFED